MDFITDVLIIGSGIGGATMARGLAESGMKILILERGSSLVDSPETRDDREIFQNGYFRSDERWWDADQNSFQPGNFYNVGGNSKFYGAVMYRYRAEDFERREHPGGVSKGWPFRYAELEPWYGAAEKLFKVRGCEGEDPSEPFHSSTYSFEPVPHEQPIAEVSDRLKRVGLHPSSLPLAVDHEMWTKRAKTPWDGFPDTRTGKIDAETGPLAEALRFDNVQLKQNAEVLRLILTADGKTIDAVVFRTAGEEHTVHAKTFVLAAGAVNSAVLLLRSADSKFSKGLANSSDQVGRNFMNHNTTAMMAIDPWLRNDSIYQKTLGINDFYIYDDKVGAPLGNVQLLGKISAPILKANIPMVPEFLLKPVTNHSVDWYLMSEDLPNPNSRVRINGARIQLDWIRSNINAHLALQKRMRDLFKAAGFPIVLSKMFDGRAPSHQCGTAIMGNDPAYAVVDKWCRSHDHENLYVVDASVLPTSAAVNPALTIAALALRTADFLLSQVLKLQRN